MPTTSTSYIARLIHILSSFLLAIFLRKRSEPELPTFNHAAPESHSSDSLATWQQDKQLFLRRPSLVKAATRDGPPPMRRHQEPPEKSRPVFPCPPVICVQDWSSVEINMSEFFLPTRTPPSSRSNSNIVPSKIETISEQSERSAEPLENSKQPDSPKATTNYVVSALSAVSGTLFDFPSCPSTFSTPLPLQDVVVRHDSRRRSLLAACGVRDSLLPYPDLFDFDLYGRRVSQESFHETIQLPSLMFEEDEFMDIGSGPVALYSIHAEDRYCAALSASPKRSPLKSTLNVDKGSKAPAEKIWWKNGEEGVVNYDELSRCEWSEEEFLKTFPQLHDGFVCTVLC